MMDYRRIALNPIDNLYNRLQINPAGDCARDVLDIDTSLEHIGIAADMTPRKELAVAWKILKEPEYRQLYDEKMLGKPVKWDDLAHLATYGVVPASALFQDTVNPRQTPNRGNGTLPPRTPQQPGFTQPGHSQARFPQSGFPQPAPTQNHAAVAPPVNPNPTHQGFSPFAGYTAAGVSNYVANLAPISGAPTGMNGVPRASYGSRVWMGILDLMLCSGVVGPAFALWDDHVVLGALIQALTFIVYFVMTETLLGGSPAKLIFGYRVQNALTGEKLSFGEALRRNWWRIIAAIPGLGGLISLIAAIHYGNSIDKSDYNVGEHDRMVKAEVVKKTH